MEITVRSDPFFTDTHIRVCHSTKCIFHDLNSADSTGVVGCTLKHVEIDEDGTCSTRTEAKVRKATVGEVKDYVESKGIIVKE